MRNKVFILLFVFCSCSDGSETIKIKGSDTEVNLSVTLAEQFHDVNDEILISVSGGGSGLGIASLLNGNTTIANSSRSIKASEEKLFEEKGIDIDAFIFAQDAIAFVVSDKIEIDSINVEVIGKILSGEYENWSSLGLVDKPINIYGRQSNSGTYDYVKDLLEIKYSPYARQMNGNAQILEAVKADNSSFGYVSAGYVMKGNNLGVRVLSIYTDRTNAVSPLDTEAIASGDYYFQRPLFQYFRKEDYNKIKPFIDFVKSSIGAKIIIDSGYYPASK